MSIALFVASAGLLTAATLARARNVFTNHDVAWTVAAGVRVLDGATYSVDVIDNNPPLIYWLCAALAAVGRVFDVPPLTAYYAAALVAVFASAALVRAVLRASLSAPGWADALAVALSGMLVLLPSAEFGQRDHLMIVFTTPYVIGAAAAVSGRPVGRGLRSAIGLLAGIGIALKPHFALLWLAVEGMVIVRRRDLRLVLRAESVGIAGVLVAYAIGVLVFAPDYLRDAPLLYTMHAAYGARVPLVSGTSGLVALALLAAFAPLAWAPAREAARMTAVAALACLAAFHLQAMDFPYQALPARASAAMALLLAAAAALGASASVRRQVLLRDVTAVVVAALASYALLAVPTPGPRSLRLTLVRLIDARAGGEPVVFFSSSVPPAHPVLNFTHSRSASPYSCLWLIAGHYSVEERARVPFAYRDLDAMPETERAFVEAFVTTLVEERPRLLVFDRSARKHGFGATDFDFERYFGADPRFGPLLSSRYRWLRRVGYLDVYLLTDDPNGDPRGGARARSQDRAAPVTLNGDSPVAAMDPHG